MSKLRAGRTVGTGVSWDIILSLGKDSIKLSFGNSKENVYKEKYLKYM